MDPYLLGIVRAAEGSRQMPPLFLVTTGGDVVAGTPAPASSFADEMAGPLEGMMARALKSRPRRDRKDDPGDARALASEALETFSEADDNEVVLTLRQARVTWSGRGDGAEVPAVRVAVSAVAAWWLAGAGKEVKGAPGVSFGVGALMPVGN